MRAVLFTGSAFAALCLPLSAAAQGSGAAGEATSPNDPYSAQEEASTGNSIVVTATKREVTLQEVPVAVTVTTAETLERGQIRDLRDLQTVVPSLQVGQRNSVGSTNFFIRGFGNGANNAGIEPSVGVFVDNVYRSRTVSQITDLPNVQRIEVLRGPQSTLFGKNASAGVISLTTQEPQFDLGGSAEVTYGNYDQMIAKGYITGPLSDTAAVSLAAGINKRDGFFRDLGTGDRTNERDRWFVRGQFLFDSGAGLRARVIGDFDQIDENCCAVVNLQDGEATPIIRSPLIGGQVNVPAARFANIVYNNFNSTNDIKNYGVSAQLDYDLSDTMTVTSISAYRKTKAITDQDPDFTAGNLIYPNAQDLKVGTLTQELRLNAEFGERANLLLGAFYINEDVDQTNQLRYAAQFRNYANLLVQGRTSCLGALFTSPCLAIPGYTGPAPISLETTFGALEGNPAKYIGQFFAAGQGFTEAYTLDSEAYSLFGQLDFEMFEGLVLTVGANYTHDEKRFVTNAASTDVFSSINFDDARYAPFRRQLLAQLGVATAVGTALGLPAGTLASTPQVMAFAAANPAAFSQINTAATANAAANFNNPLANPLAVLRILQYMPPFLNVPNAVESGRTNDNDLAYTVRLAYDVSDAVNVYASYATGFKASSINLSRDSRPSPADRDAIIAAGLALNNLIYTSRFAGPEESRVIEAGLKGNWGDVSANIAVFHQEISGFQSNIFTGSGFALRNAGKLSTYGAEFEGVATIADALTLNLGVTWLDPKYDSFVQSSVGDLSGTKPAGIPEWTVLIGAQYEHPLPGGVIVPRVSFLWQEETQLIEGLPGFLVRNPDGTIASNTEALAVAAPFTREVEDLTASLSYEMESGLILSIWGRNLLDSRDVGVVFDSPAQPRGISGYPNDPRTYGATARFRW